MRTMSEAAELSKLLASQAEAVCRAYLPAGRRSGRYWIVGDAEGGRGRSLYVKLHGEGAGKWTDAATGEHGDLIDLIRLNRGYAALRDALAEAKSYLGHPERHQAAERPAAHLDPPKRDSTAALTLYRLSRPVSGTLAETYLRRRAITALLDQATLRFHPSCYYRPEEATPRQSWPALLGIVTDLAGTITGVHRTYLARDGSDKAPFEEPRRAMGQLLGNAVRFGKPLDVMAAGEGIETVLSLLSLFPALPMAAGLSAPHLAALLFPPGLRRLYILRDNDPAGDFAQNRLTERSAGMGIQCRILKPAAKDLNVDLRNDPHSSVLARMLAQLGPDDRARFSPNPSPP
jgi:hypothetical protein